MDGFTGRLRLREQDGEVLLLSDEAVTYAIPLSLNASPRRSY